MFNAAQLFISFRVLYILKKTHKATVQKCKKKSVVTHVSYTTSIDNVSSVDST